MTRTPDADGADPWFEVEGRLAASRSRLADERLRAELGDLGIQIYPPLGGDDRAPAAAQRASGPRRVWWAASFAVVVLGVLVALAILGRPLQPIDRRAPECRYGACR